MRRGLLMILVLAGCHRGPDSADSGEPHDSGDTRIDADQDGYLAGVDCDDDDATIHPQAEERCDGRDEDCDGEADEDAVDAGTWYADADADGAGDPLQATRACAPPAGSVDEAGDCDDANAAVHPGAAEICNHVDDDCDASTGEAGLATVDGVATFTVLQEAIDASTATSTVAVCAGTWAGGVVLDHDLVVIGLDGPEVTRLQGDGTVPVVTVTGGSARLVGLTVSGGAGATTGDGFTAGGGLLAIDADAVELEDCHVSANTAERGAGVAGPITGELRVLGGAIVDNVATQRGGGLLVTAAVLEATELSGNEARFGGGVYVQAGGSLTDSGSILSANTSTESGAGAYLAAGAEATLVGTRFDGDRAGRYAGGVYLETGAVLSTSNVTFDNEASQDKGGAVYAFGATVSTSDTTIVGCSGSWGGAMFLYGSELGAEHTDLQYNTAELGGALYVYLGSSVTLTDSRVAGNLSAAGGGARLKSEASLVSTGTDWGEGTDDNVPDDVDVSPGTSYSGWTPTDAFACTNATQTCEPL